MEKTDYEKSLENYTYNDGKHIFDRIKNSDGLDDRENLDILNEIVLWKINRIPYVSAETMRKVRKLPVKTTDDLRPNKKQIKECIMELLSSKGIQLPMASTILRFFYPDAFLIFDQRAYREVYKTEEPTFYGKDANEKYYKVYMDYIEKCVEYQKEHCPNVKFRDLDKAFYQADKDKNNRVKY